MAGVELRSLAFVCGGFRNRIRPYRSPPKFCLSSYAVALGQRRTAADVHLGTALVFAHSRCDLLGRVRVALASSRRPDRQRRYPAGESIPASSSYTNRARRLHASAYALLVRLEQCIPPFALRRRRSFLVAFDHRHRAGTVTACSFRSLPLIDDRRSGLFQFSVGRSFAGNWFSINLFCAV